MLIWGSAMTELRHLFNVRTVSMRGQIFLGVGLLLFALTGCNTTTQQVVPDQAAPVAVSSDQGVQDFRRAVLERCLPAALTGSKVNTSGLKALSQNQKTLLLGGAVAPAYFVGERAVLVTPIRGVCQVGMYVGDHRALRSFPEEWLIGQGAPFREGPRPAADTRFFVAPGGASVSFTQRPNLTLLMAVRSPQ